MTTITLNLTRDNTLDKLVSNPLVAGSPAFQAVISAPQDGGTVVVSSDTLTFTQPDEYIWDGFGNGYMYSRTDGLPFQGHTVSTAQGDKVFTYEDTAGNERRFAHTLSGVKYWRHVLAPVANPTEVGGGMILFDHGSQIPAGKTTFMYARKRITKTRPEDSAALFQLKQDRIGFTTSTSDGNEVYLKQDKASGAMAMDCYEGGPAVSTAKAYFFGNNGPQSDGLLTDFMWSMKVNTVDVADGYIYSACAKNDTWTRSTPFNATAPNNPTMINRSTSAEFMRYFKEQGYLGNNDDAARDIEYLITDIFWQLNGHVFLLVDNIVEAERKHAVPLVPTSFNGSGNWSFSLWKGKMPDYSSFGIVMVDSTLTQVAGVQIK